MAVIEINLNKKDKLIVKAKHSLPVRVFVDSDNVLKVNVWSGRS